ncbi:MAG: prepilin-type N-terminal cleavage/methylation domain-containing protein [Planctomycetota bacterium]|nr:prepilin-type N-terminal cleavage/methylation domain-containing protein [Planctomycetota bacterium]
MRTFHPLSRAAFTIVEILIVLLVLAIGAAIVIPNIGSANDSQAIAAAAILQSDLEVARSMAMATQAPYSVVFSADRQSYKVVANYAGGAYAATTAIGHPVKKNQLYEVKLSGLNGMTHVTVAAASFGGQPFVTFQSLGQPNAGGSVIMTIRQITMTVSVEAMTGIVSVTRTGT